MICPSDPERAARRVHRCVAHVRERGPVTVASARGVTRMRNHSAFLEWLTSPSVARPASHVWLCPSSAGWDLFAEPLGRAGWDVRLTRRRGEYLGLYIAKTGKSFGLDAAEKGREWYGGSAVDLVDVERGLSAEEETRSTLEQLQELDRVVGEHWPGVALDCSIASTAVSAFKRYLLRPIGLSRAIASDLTELDAYGGGHIERFCARGASFHASAGMPPWEFDLTSAYPTAMGTVPIPGEFLRYGTEGEALDPCTLSTAIVTVPERLYPPLRFRVGRHLFYPWGSMLGTWSALELRAAVAAGCKIERVARVMVFEEREEFAAFAQSLLSFRRSAGPTYVRDFAKSLAVQFVGALGSRVKTSRVVTCPENLSGCKLDRPGLYSEPIFEPSERQLLSAALTITGATAAWLGLVLRGCELVQLPAYYIHTDGGGTLGDPRPALDLAGALGQQIPALCFPQGHRLTSATSSGEAWKVEALASARCWAPNRRVMVTEAGEERVAAGGISRTLTHEEILCQMAEDAPTAWTRSHRREAGGWTLPFHARDLEPEITREIEGLLP